MHPGWVNFAFFVPSMLLKYDVRPRSLDPFYISGYYISRSRLTVKDFPQTRTSGSTDVVFVTVTKPDPDPGVLVGSGSDLHNMVESGFSFKNMVKSRYSFVKKLTYGSGFSLKTRIRIKNSFKVCRQTTF